MMKNMSKTDRYIVIGSIGVLLISLCITFNKILRQELKKDQIKVAQQKTLRKEILNIKTWRHYHEEQMLLMQEILTELKHQNQDSVWTQQKNTKVNFQKTHE